MFVNHANAGIHLHLSDRIASSSSRSFKLAECKLSIQALAQNQERTSSLDSFFIESILTRYGFSKQSM